MENIAIFVEGLTECIFIRSFLYNIFNLDNISITFIQLFKRYNSIPSILNPNAKVAFFIYDVGGEGNVIGSIKDRESGLFNKGFIKIIGLQDMYSLAYEKVSPGKISPQLTSKIIATRNNEIAKMSRPNQIKSCYSIMEIEAWFLAISKLLQKIDTRLTISFIKAKLGFDLRKIDPETFFFKPSVKISKLYSLVGKNYNKSRGCIENLTKNITKKDILDLLTSNKVQSFGNFHNEVVNEYNAYLS